MRFESLSVANECEISGSSWYITIKVLKIYNGKTEVVSFVIESVRMLTIGVKFEVNVKT